MVGVDGVGVVTVPSVFVIVIVADAGSKEESCGSLDLDIVVLFEAW